MSLVPRIERMWIVVTSAVAIAAACAASQEMGGAAPDEGGPAVDAGASSHVEEGQAAEADASPRPEGAEPAAAAPLDPAAPPAPLQCGKAGEAPSFHRGADCWIAGPGLGKLPRVADGRVWIEDSSATKVPGYLDQDGWTLRFVTDEELEEGKRYSYVLDLSGLATDGGRPLVITNARLEGSRWRYCFDPAEDAMTRNGSDDHGCD